MRVQQPELMRGGEEDEEGEWEECVEGEVSCAYSVFASVACHVSVIKSAFMCMRVCITISIYVCAPLTNGIGGM